MRNWHQFLLIHHYNHIFCIRNWCQFLYIYRILRLQLQPMLYSNIQRILRLLAQPIIIFNIHNILRLQIQPMIIINIQMILRLSSQPMMIFNIHWILRLLTPGVLKRVKSWIKESTLKTGWVKCWIFGKESTFEFILNFARNAVHITFPHGWHRTDWFIMLSL